MKMQLKISIKIILLTVVFFCAGINSFSNYNNQFCSIEFSTEANAEVNSFSSDIDSYEDDQIIQKKELSKFGIPMGFISALQNYFIIQQSTISVWQPPEIS